MFKVCDVQLCWFPMKLDLDISSLPRAELFFTECLKFYQPNAELKKDQQNAQYVCHVTRKLFWNLLTIDIGFTSSFRVPA